MDNHKVLSAGYLRRGKSRVNIKPLEPVVALLLIVIVFQKSIDNLFFDGRASFLDELCILILILIAAAVQFWNRGFQISFIIPFGIMIYIVVVSLLLGENKNLVQVTIQAFLYMQYFLILVSLAVLYDAKIRCFNNVLLVVFLLSLLGAVLQFLAPVWFASVFGESNYIKDLAAGMFRLEGFQRNPNAFGVLCALMAIYQMFLLKRKNTFNVNPLFLLAILGAFLSGSRTAMLFVFIGILLTSYKRTVKVVMMVVISFVLLTISILGLGDFILEKTEKNMMQVTGSVDESKYIRWLMMYHGTVLAIEHFPFGTGAGTFGSVYSHDSPLYEQLGIADLPTVSEARGIYDSNYGSIAGEFGFIGLIIFFGGGWLLLKRVLLKRTPSFFSAHIAFFNALSILALISPFMRPLFSSSYYGALFALVALAYVESAWARVSLFQGSCRVLWIKSLVLGLTRIKNERIANK